MVKKRFFMTAFFVDSTLAYGTIDSSKQRRSDMKSVTTRAIEAYMDTTAYSIEKVGFVTTLIMSCVIGFILFNAMLFCIDWVVVSW